MLVLKQLREMAGVELTRKQLRVYARAFVGMTHEEIAAELNIKARDGVTKIIARALARNPSLPKPEWRGRHRVRAA